MEVPAKGGQAKPVMDFLNALVIIRCSALTNLVIWREHFFAMAMSIVLMTGKVYWSRLRIVIEAMTSFGSFEEMQPLLIPRFIAILKQRGISMLYD